MVHVVKTPVRAQWCCRYWVGMLVRHRLGECMANTPHISQTDVPFASVPNVLNVLNIPDILYVFEL
jgi:hypothetical protein